MGKERIPIYELPYSAGLMSQSCWFVEFKKIVQLIAAGKTEEEIKSECLENNLLGAVKEYRAKRMYGYLINRASMLDDELVRLFMESDLATQKVINLIAILRGDRLFFEFVYEVYREKALLGQHILEDSNKPRIIIFTTPEKGSTQHADLQRNRAAQKSAAAQTG